MASIQERSDDLEQFATRAISRPKDSAYQMILSQMLFASIAVSPLQRIRMICEAIAMIDRRQAMMKGIYMDGIDTFYPVAIALLSPERNANGTVSIGWGFRESGENYIKYAKQWYRNVEMKVDQYERELRSRNHSIANAIPEDIAFFAGSHALTEVGFRQLQNAFVDWVRPSIGHSLGILTHRFVNAQTMNAIQEAVYGKSGEPKE